MKTKLIYIIDNLDLAGAQVHLFNLAKGMRKIGYDNIKVVSMSGEGEVFDWMVQRGIPVRNFRMKSVRRPVFLLDFVRLISYLRKEKPEIVHTYLDTANVFGVIAAKLAGVDRIMTSRRDLGVFRSRIMEILMGILSNHVERVVCVCQMAANESIRREHLHGNNIMVINNGIDAEKYSVEIKAKSNTAPIYCNVAVPNREEKGHTDLVNAFAIVSKKLPGARLRLVGEGPLLQGLKQQADELGIGTKIHFWGKSFDIPAALKDVSAFVLPSHSEGISNALLEAMSMGIPAVVTNVGGNPEVVKDGETGVLVQARNPESFAQGMLQIVSDPEKMFAMGLAAREFVKVEFSYAKMISGYDALYNSSIAYL